MSDIISSACGASVYSAVGSAAPAGTCRHVVYHHSKSMPEQCDATNCSGSWSTTATHQQCTIYMHAVLPSHTSHHAVHLHLAMRPQQQTHTKPTLLAMQAAAAAVKPLLSALGLGDILLGEPELRAELAEARRELRAWKVGSGRACRPAWGCWSAVPCGTSALHCCACYGRVGGDGP